MIQLKSKEKVQKWKKKKKDPVVSPDQIQTMKMLHIYASYFYSSWFISYKTTKKKEVLFRKAT
jgi:hypothetical protein